MTRTASSQLTYYVLGLAAIVIAALFVWQGATAAKGAAAGAAVGIANWYALRFLIGRMLVGTVRSQALFSGLLFLKLGALLGLVFLLLYTGLFQPIPFTIGLSTLVVGVLAGAFIHMTAAPAAQSES
jgi:hypothetical protein